MPYPAGGTTDMLGRALGQAMGRQLGQPVVIDNKAGASATVGATQVLHSPPDGHTIPFGTPADSAKDFEPIGCMLREAGVPLDIYTWGCLLAPARTPQDVLDKLHAAMQEAPDDPAVAQVIETSGGEKFPGSRADARKFLDGERAMSGNVIRTRKIQAD